MPTFSGTRGSKFCRRAAALVLRRPLTTATEFSSGAWSGLNRSQPARGTSLTRRRDHRKPAAAHRPAGRISGRPARARHNQGMDTGPLRWARSPADRGTGRKRSRRKGGGDAKPVVGVDRSRGRPRTFTRTAGPALLLEGDSSRRAVRPVHVRPRPGGKGSFAWLKKREHSEAAWPRSSRGAWEPRAGERRGRPTVLRAGRAAPLSSQHTTLDPSPATI